MVTCQGIGEQMPQQRNHLVRILGRSRRVIHMTRLCLGTSLVLGPKICLEFFRVLSQIMPQTGQTGPLSGIENGCKVARSFRNGAQMIVQPLPLGLRLSLPAVRVVCGPHDGMRGRPPPRVPTLGLGRILINRELLRPWRAVPHPHNPRYPRFNSSGVVCRVSLGGRGRRVSFRARLSGPRTDSRCGPR